MLHTSAPMAPRPITPMQNGIVVFNTPGANANAVKELVLAAMLIASRDILGGAEWVQEQASPGWRPPDGAGQ